ncbi:MucR family transcriptional regulator [Methylobacterium durans]|uniref:MucR family transcriptional regulator n=1 Tax=Methylobacterium durans TaxID=2202825 RepID=UPI002B00077E|nr:MucR family transcriptional regulator [Methylobacterium durans]MEA1834767.1 MucR family transcriptional regulator [Methylobacterium durans]
MGASLCRRDISVQSGVAATGDSQVELTAAIVSAYIARNHIAAGEIPSLIAGVHATLNSLGGGAAAAEATDEVEKATPSQIRKSITPDALISFIDRKPYKTLKRHLTANGLDPHSYRERYGLPSEYPMVAPTYAARRSEVAKAIGLGRIGGQAAATRGGAHRRAD